MLDQPNFGRVIGGASRDRTDDLIVANDALSQLSYSPTGVVGLLPFYFISVIRVGPNRRAPGAVPREAGPPVHGVPQPH